MERKKIADMTKEERAAYQAEWYRNHVKGVGQTIKIELHDCPPSLVEALIGAIKGEK